MRFLKKGKDRIIVKQKEIELGLMFKIPSDEYVIIPNKRIFTMKMLKKIYDKGLTINAKIGIRNLLKNAEQKR